MGTRSRSNKIAACDIDGATGMSTSQRFKKLKHDFMEDMFDDEDPPKEEEMAYYRKIRRAREICVEYKKANAVQSYDELSKIYDELRESRERWKANKIVCWREFDDDLAPVHFYKMFHMDRASFLILLGRLKPFMMAKSDVQGSVSPEVRIAMTLQYLAGGRVSIAKRFGVSQENLSESVWITVDAINQTHKIKFPTTREAFVDIAKEFRAQSPQECIKECVGALGGCFIEIDNPGEDVDCEEDYRIPSKDQKKRYGLLARAVCDADGKFTYIDVGAPETETKNRFQSTLLYRYFKSGKCPTGFFLIGDATYLCQDWLLTRFPGKHDVGSAKDSFNYAHEVLHAKIENAFRQLVIRFGVLWRKLRVSHERRASLVLCCAKLHNFCVEQRVKNEYCRSDKGWEVQPGVWVPEPTIQLAGSAK